MHAGSLFEEQKIFDVVVWGMPETRHSLDNIRELLIDTPGGGHVRLGEVADVRVVASPTVIRHDAISPYLDVAFNVEGRRVNAVIADVDAITKNFAFPLEYHAEIVSDYVNRQIAQQNILIAAVVAALGIFLLLQAAYRSWRLAFAAIVTLPMALTGGLLAAYLLGDGISITSVIGLLAILGIAVRNGILMTSHFHHLEEQEGMPFGPELVLRGSSERLAPILMTALTTGLAFLPFVIFGNAPGYELVRPMAIVILGGLATTMLLDLFALPALYLRFGASREADLGFHRADAPALAAD
jgi:Cu/Ag efflux pump CusA